jgi:hypothetical protein
MDRGSCRGGFQTRPGAADEDHPAQRGYYEHVIRNEKALDRVGAYIANNPVRWADPQRISRERFLAKKGGFETRPYKSPNLRGFMKGSSQSLLPI